MKRPDGGIQACFEGKVSPNAQKRFIPLRLAKPFNKEEAQQVAASNGDKRPS
jgi:hypothetical protein